MVKWFHTVSLSVCVSDCVCLCLRWHSVVSAVSVVCVGPCVRGSVCECVCVLETPKPPSTPDLLKSHDTP